MSQQSQSSQPKQGLKTEIVVAIISAVAVVAAAVITILPGLLRSDSAPPPSPPVTAVTVIAAEVSPTPEVTPLAGPTSTALPEPATDMDASATPEPTAVPSTAVPSATPAPPRATQPPPATPSTTAPAAQAITPDNAGLLAQTRWAKVFGSPVDIALSPNGKTLAVASNFAVLIYDVLDLDKPQFELNGHKTLSSLAFSPDGHLLASGGSSFDGTIRLWDMTRGGVEQSVLEGHTEAVFGLAFSPDGALLASGSRDNSVRLWDVNTRAEVFFSTDHGAWVTAVAFSPDGAMLASGGADGKIRLWSAASRKLLHVLDAQTSQVDCVAFSPDGALLASAGQYDTDIRLWDVETWETRTILRGHTSGPGGSGVYRLAFNQSGDLLASGGGDGSLRVWDARQESQSFGAELAALKRHADWVDGLAFSSDGTMLISSSERDGAVRVWQAVVTQP